MDIIKLIMVFVNGLESTDKSQFIEDLLLRMDEDTLSDIQFRIDNGLPLLGD